MSRILIIEDDIGISAMVKEFLICEGFEIDLAYDGMEAMDKLNMISYDLILLDLMIPKISGMQVMKNIRTNSKTPIIIVSAKDTDSDKAIGLGLGADDYITKPFSLVELLARVKANIRRATLYAPSVEEKESIIYKDLVINCNQYSVSRDGEEIRLTAKEFEILKLFALHPNRVYTKAQIYQIIWGEVYQNDENAINVHMRRLREKIEVDPGKPQYIQTLWGIGYRMGDVV